MYPDSEATDEKSCVRLTFDHHIRPLREHRLTLGVNDLFSVYRTLPEERTPPFIPLRVNTVHRFQYLSSCSLVVNLRSSGPTSHTAHDPA